MHPFMNDCEKQLELCFHFNQTTQLRRRRAKGQTVYWRLNIRRSDNAFCNITKRLRGYCLALIILKCEVHLLMRRLFWKTVYSSLLCWVFRRRNIWGLNVCLLWNCRFQERKFANNASWAFSSSFQQANACSGKSFQPRNLICSFTCN